MLAALLSRCALESRGIRTAHADRAEPISPSRASSSCRCCTSIRNMLPLRCSQGIGISQAALAHASSRSTFETTIFGTKLRFASSRPRARWFSLAGQSSTCASLQSWSSAARYGPRDMLTWLRSVRALLCTIDARLRLSRNSICPSMSRRLTLYGTCNNVMHYHKSDYTIHGPIFSPRSVRHLTLKLPRGTRRLHV